MEDIRAAGEAVCRAGYAARVYGRSAAGELDWLMETAAACAVGQAEAERLRPLAELAAARTTLRERNNHDRTTV